jgi:hypothetical protein
VILIARGGHITKFQKSVSLGYVCFGGYGYNCYAAKGGSVQAGSRGFDSWCVTGPSYQEDNVIYLE